MSPVVSGLLPLPMPRMACHRPGGSRQRNVEQRARGAAASPSLCDQGLLPSCPQCQRAKKVLEHFVQITLQLPRRPVFHGKPVIWVSEEEGRQSCDTAGTGLRFTHLAGRSYFQKLLPSVFSSLGGQHPFPHILLPFPLRSAGW